MRGAQEVACGAARHLLDVDMEIADRIGLEFAFGRGFAFDLRQPGDPVALQTPVKGRARQMRDCGLQGALSRQVEWSGAKSW
jgi:hypothetical protein